MVVLVVLVAMVVLVVLVAMVVLVVLVVMVVLLASYQGCLGTRLPLYMCYITSGRIVMIVCY